MNEGRSALRLFGLNLMAAAAYAVVGTAVLYFSQLSGLASPMWPSAGLAFAAVYLFGWRVAPGVAVGSFLVNAPLLSGNASATGLFVAACIGVGAALQAGIGSTLVNRLVGRRSAPTEGRRILLFLLLAGPLACIINPTVGLAVQVSLGVIDPRQAWLSGLTWWVGDSIGVIVFAPLVLMLWPSTSHLWVGRRWKIAVPSLLVLTVLMLALAQNLASDRDEVATQVDHLVDEASSQLEDNLGRHQEALMGIEGLFTSSNEVSRADFRRYTESLLERFPNIHALSWNPWVTNAERPAFEEEQQFIEGYPNYVITERTADGNLVPASARPEYVPVAYIEPIDENQAAVGYDILSDPLRAAAIETARDTGNPAVTAPVNLVQATGTQKGMLSLVPVYSGSAIPTSVEQRRSTIKGFAVGVYLLDDLLTETFTGADWDKVDIVLTDVTNGQSLEVGSVTARTPATIDVADRDGLPTASRTVVVDGRQWELSLTPTSGPLATTGAPSLPWLLISGLVIVFLLESFLMLVTGNERKARREAELARYDAEHDPLTGLLNRRGFVRVMEVVAGRLREDPSPNVLLFMDIDGFKPVNDSGGHELGDRALVDVANVLQRFVRSRDAVARMGGDEFAILLPNCLPERGQQIAERVRDAIAAFDISANGNGIKVGASIGLTTIDEDDYAEIDELVRRADVACYQAKRSGGSAIRWFVGDDVDAPAT